MKVLIINPNSDVKMTKAIDESARNFVKDRFILESISLEDSPAFVGSYEDIAMVGKGLIECIKKNQDKYHAFIIACHLDPNLDAAKEVSNKLVIGIGEASMKIASLLGKNFSVIGSSNKTTHLKKELVAKYGLKKYLKSVRTPDEGLENSTLEEKLIFAAKKAIEEDKAEILVLGCAGFAGIDKTIEKIVKVKVLDGIVCALMIAEGMVNYQN